MAINQQLETFHSAETGNSSGEPPQKRRILLVDDEKEAVKAMFTFFAGTRSFEPSCVNSGEDAVAAMDKTAFDVALLDIRMPGMNGIETLKRIRVIQPDCVVIMLTAVDDAQMAMDAIKLGASDYLRKPVILADLVHSIESVLEKERLRKENLSYQRDLEKRVAEQTESLRSLNLTLEQASIEIVTALAGAIEAKDPYTEGHSRRVTAYTVALGKAMGINGSGMEMLEYGALLHDIGKIGMREEILTAPRKLTMDEYAHVKLHPEIGAKIVSGINFLKEASAVIRHHHERFDGSGYPDGLAGDQIELSARITGVADVYDALTSDRPYRKPHSLGEALQILVDGKGKSFDPDIVDIFVNNKIFDTVK